VRPARLRARVQTSRHDLLMTCEPDE
jgi:hypothetical protein